LHERTPIVAVYRERPSTTPCGIQAKQQHFNASKGRPFGQRDYHIIHCLLLPARHSFSRPLGKHNLFPIVNNPVNID